MFLNLDGLSVSDIAVEQWVILSVDKDVWN
jgi:hypothetical protein